MSQQKLWLSHSPLFLQKIVSLEIQVVLLKYPKYHDITFFAYRFLLCMTQLETWLYQFLILNLPCASFSLSLQNAEVYQLQVDHLMLSQLLYDECCKQEWKVLKHFWTRFSGRKIHKLHFYKEMWAVKKTSLLRMNKSVQFLGARILFFKRSRWANVSHSE